MGPANTVVLVVIILHAIWTFLIAENVARLRIDFERKKMTRSKRKRK